MCHRHSLLRQRAAHSAALHQEAARLYDGASCHLACFISQQVAEKVLWALLYAQDEECVVGQSGMEQALGRPKATQNPRYASASTWVFI
jgi:HEPN domain-containing protein